MKRFLVPALLMLSLFLTACSATSTPLPSDPNPAPVSTQAPDAVSGDPSSPSIDSATRIDQQGAIVVEVTPLNLDSPTDTLDFNVLIDTHSIDLSMDLATLATLTTDTGITVQATLWDAPRGGHHVEGKLSFPSMRDGKPIMKGVKKLTLTVIELDAPSRIFAWELK